VTWDETKASVRAGQVRLWDSGFGLHVKYFVLRYECDEDDLGRRCCVVIPLDCTPSLSSFTLGVQFEYAWNACMFSDSTEVPL
jgi:hypothetical protein